MQNAMTALVVLVVALAHASAGEQWAWERKTNVLAERREAAAMLVGYFEEMCRPKPLEVRKGEELKAHQRALRQKLLECAGLWPLPERVPLDARLSEPLDHDWCTVRRVAYQLWPEVYSTGLLYVPKQFAEKPAPAILRTHGHWPNGNANPEVQKSCLVPAKMGYIVFSSAQNHYEDLPLGVSHQTLMIWNNIRALDYLQSLPEADAKRIGVTGCSGGGLQAQMLVAADVRVRAASIVGMTCDYREIVFPGAAHCACNHFPNVMRHTDEPELSALGLPCPVQYLTMNDWTRSFEANNYPVIRKLYEANGLADRTDCKYWPTGHDYAKEKRERMYWWMEKWLRGKDAGGPIPEPEAKPFPVEAIEKLKADTKGDKGFGHISRLFAQKAGGPPKLASREDWLAYRQKMRGALRELLGEPLPARAKARAVRTEEADGLATERALVPSEANVLVPTLVVRPAACIGRLPVIIICGDGGKDALLTTVVGGVSPRRETRDGDVPPTALAKGGSVVVLPDVRFTGELSLRAMAGLTGGLLTFKPCSPVGEGNPAGFDGAWQRNALLWGRPLPGMAATDLCAILDWLAARPDADLGKVTLRAKGNAAFAALLAAAWDDRVAALDIDLGGRCFAKRNAPLVPFVLRHGDVLQWAALLADRRLTIAGLPPEAGDPSSLKDAFLAAGNPDGLLLGHR
ncbi:MAG: hypothetical protein FJ291_08590 [Planctomycetes bacterium]|nr:hypothetical protein [Planctomycetota bacterium]